MRVFPPGTWVYCQDCKRCYLTGEERMSDEPDYLLCAYEDCEYGDFYDAVDWSVVQRLDPSFPVVPERGVCYILKSKVEGDRAYANEIKEAFDYQTGYDQVHSLASVIGKVGEETYLPFSSLSSLEKIPFHVCRFDAEVANGGFHQFFTNPTGDDWQEILESLKMIGAAKTVSIFQKALSIFPGSNPSKNQKARWSYLVDVDQKVITLLHDLSKEYYHECDSLFDTAAAYLQDNLEHLSRPR
jgi:hypothetical protein